MQRLALVVALAACGKPADPPRTDRTAAPVPARNLPPPLAPPVRELPPPPTPPPAPPDAAADDERATAITTLTQSGPAAEDWDADGLRLLADVAPPPIEATGAACFVAGCGVTLTFPSLASYRETADRLAASSWTGGKRLTSAESAAGGKVTAALILYRPD